MIAKPAAGHSPNDLFHLLDRVQFADIVLAGKLVHIAMQVLR